MRGPPFQRTKAHPGRRVEFANICKANVIGLMLFTLILSAEEALLYIWGISPPECSWCFFVLNILLLAGERLAIRLFLRSLRTNGYNQKHVLLIGYSRAAEGFIDRVTLIRNGAIISRVSWMTIKKQVMFTRKSRF